MSFLNFHYNFNLHFAPLCIMAKFDFVSLHFNIVKYTIVIPNIWFSFTTESM